MISLLVINYRAAGLAIAAIASARRVTANRMQVVVVDNSGDAAETDRLRPHADVVVMPRSNLGYAGGINAGRSHCTGEIIVICNPDVVFSDGSIEAMVRVMTKENAAAAGPALFWDDGYHPRGLGAKLYASLIAQAIG